MSPVKFGLYTVVVLSDLSGTFEQQFYLCPQMKPEKQDLPQLNDLLLRHRVSQMLPQSLAGEAA